MTARMSTHRYVQLILAVVIAAGLGLESIAQTKITMPPNKYSVADDIKLGR